MATITNRSAIDGGVVLLTNGSSHGWSIATGLRERDIRIRAVILEAPTLAALGARALHVVRRGGFRALAEAVSARVAQGRRGAPRRRPSVADWRMVCDELVHVGTLAGDDCREALSALRPAIGILGGAPMMPIEILSIPQLATLNAHPGLLPAYRGVDVVAWAILNGDPVGVTVHVVDSGMDTGPICRTAPVPIHPGDDLAAVRARSEAVAGRVMAEVVAAGLDAGRIDATPQATRTGRYRRMDAPTRQAARARLGVD